MNAPTADILAFHRPAVNGEVCELGLNLAPGGVARLRGSVDLLRAMASAILSATGGSTAIAKRSDDAVSEVIARVSTRTAEGRSKLALYERVAATVRALGISWVEAGERVGGVNGAAAYQYFYDQRRQAAKKLKAAVGGRHA